MWKKIGVSFSLAGQNIRSRLFHTILSILGIVIGVAALVAVLSLIDGMEKYAQEQITNTTSLKAVFIQTETYKNVNNVRLKKTDYAYLDYNQYLKLTNALSTPARGYIGFRQNQEVKISGKAQAFGASVVGRTSPYKDEFNLAAGRVFSTKEVTNQAKVAYLNAVLARQILAQKPLPTLIGKSVIVADNAFKIIGVMDENKSEMGQVFVPFTVFTQKQLQAEPPTCILEAERVEMVPALKKEVEQWLQKNFPEKEADFRILTNELRVKQAAQGFLLFRVIMGLIVGISVVVGGIGVMNVLLISVNERTVEIGVRKALGAKKQDIMLQFLAESVTVSLFGCLMGLILGILSTLVFIPVIKALTEVPFQAAFTLNTFGLISIIALLVGIIFGTYPAIRAARLDPVEAIRRE
ncbi:MAG: ABC transporter permease [Adhaeribacter sp.]